MADDLVVLDGSTFFVSDRAGDVRGEGTSGLFFRDVRHLSTLAVALDGKPLRVLTSRVVDYYSARVFGTLATARMGLNPPVSIQRDRIVAGGVHEDLWVRNNSEVEQRLTVEIAFGGDFADIFEIKQPDTRRNGETRVELGQHEATLWHEREGLRRATRLAWSGDGDLEEGRIRFDLALLPRAEWQTCLDISCVVGGEEHAPRVGHGGFGTLQPQMPRSLDAWLADAPQLSTDSDLVAHTYRRSLVDLAALRFRPLPDLEWSLPAAGLPWFMAMFGRDSLITAYMALPFQPHLAAATLEALSQLEPAARAAIGWIDGPGDPDGDGYLEYQTRSPKGLRNQGWKDSWNAILFADGRLAEPPIAMCEIQGYAYDARRRAARLARVCWGDEVLADRLERDAAALYERFDRDFWLDRRGHYALALDRDKRPVDALTSNVGHLLWSGIVPQERARALRDRLMAPDMFSGWGIRTMSSHDAGYNPIEYHDGTVWPHDTAIVAEGLRRYGFREDASRLAWALFEAAEAFEYRLPEVFAGFDRDTTTVAVEYPTASRPQAWAAAAPLLAILTLLGLDAEDGAITSLPSLPGPIGHLELQDERV